MLTNTGLAGFNVKHILSSESSETSTPAELAIVEAQIPYIAVTVYCNAIADAKDPSQAELDKLKETSGNGMPAVPAEWHEIGARRGQNRYAV